MMVIDVPPSRAIAGDVGDDIEPSGAAFSMMLSARRSPHARRPYLVQS
jgi:hypothetical protein